ncbi:MAG: TonB-dependent receptor [Bacteroidetes bacterium]|nr:MAG: TonB-dependent receptor [Bacteroidota bacterium]PTM12357.1 MAG: TonB-dependent receptor [Bacteroidota bacterium]
MKFLSNQCIASLILFMGWGVLCLGQTVVRGEITDGVTGEPLISATAIIKGTTEGAVTEYDGTFSFNTSASPPFTMIFSYVGYLDAEVLIESVVEPIKIALSENAVTISTVEVKGRRIGERQRQSALTVETLDNIAIKETPAANFYDGLGSLKDVDLTAASLGFKIINTRGFNSTSPVRSLQLIDGVDNQSPGLNFSLGNFLGSSELDVNRVNLIVGASSAFYGPNAFNGVISMETKDPFFHKGLSILAKGGERSLFEGALRYADVFGKNKGIGYKLNFSYFQANDWVADNYDPVDNTDTGRDNPGGYDAVNIYGDEFTSGSNFTKDLQNPGLGIIHRRGYTESDVVDYDSDNLKLGAAFHFRLKPAMDLGSPTLIVASNYSTGTTVYQGDNRYSLRDIQFFQHRLELKKHDTYFLRFYVTHEDAGNSYDPYFTSLLLQENAKENQNWRNAYRTYWSTTVRPQLNAEEGFPRISQFPGNPDGYRAALSSFFAQPDIAAKLVQWHAAAQEAGLAADPIISAVGFYEPGTDRFDEEFNRITSQNLNSGGTRFYDKSALAHAQGEYRFNDLVEKGNISDFDLLVGASYRKYMPNSEGSILLDTNGRNIDTYEYGIYGGGTLELQQKLKISGSLRVDKNKNFDYLISPAGSLVYSPSDVTTLRASFSSAIRNPTLADQFLNYNVGRAILLGNLNGIDSLVTVESLTDALNGSDLNLLEYFNVAPIKPEKVQTVEAGFRTTLFQRLYLDATYYYSFYQDFIGFNIGVETVFDNTFGQLVEAQAYRVSANATDRVTTQGFSIGTNYYFSKFYVFNANYSWNKLNTVTDDPIIPAFNTPEHKYNLGLSGRNIPVNLGFLRIPNFGFSINYKWIKGFTFEGSPQFTGEIPTYDLLDAQINWQVAKLNSTFKLGASNLLNNEVFQTYGGPRIGRMAYFSVLYEFKKK